MKWHFSPQRRDQVETEVTQRDQFNNDEVDISETIVREAVQNSLDAAEDDPSRVHVSFKWIKTDTGLDPTFFKSIFEGQREHAIAADIDLDSLDFDNPTALVIEDFGTSGLTGSVSEADNNHFSDFWRRHGKSHKTGKSRGRWGLGKLVYSTTSRIGVFFGLTVRPDSDRSYLMGQTVLNLREVDGVKFPPHAFFADVEGDSDNQITVPIKSSKMVEDFIKNFSLERKSSPGLSVIIPFPDENFNIERMISVAIANYFYPLITGQLTLQFDDILINAANVREYANKYAADRFDQIDLLFDFIEEIFQAEKGTLLQLKDSWIEDNALNEEDFQLEDISRIREDFKLGRLIGLTLPVVIKLKDGTIRESFFSVYMKKPTDLQKGLDLYVRGGLTLPGEEKFKARKAFGAMIAEDEAICSFLGDAENAAHTQWTTNTEKLRRRYRSSQSLISAIKKSVVQLYDLLAGVSEDTDEDALQDFFWFDEPETKKPKKRRETPKEPLPVPNPNSRKRLFNISKVEGGFSITNAEGLTSEKLPYEITVEAAYEVNKGNAFKKYSPHDFKIGKNGTISLAADAAVKVVLARENTWTFEITSIPFRLRAVGFDEQRDVKVKVS